MIKDLLIKSYLAVAAISAYTLVVWGENEGEVKTAVDGSVPFVGATGIVGADAAGDMTDVTRLGLPDVRLGGVVPRGTRVTADAQGRAVAAGAGEYYLGFTDTSGVENDVVPLIIAPGKMPAA